MYMYTHCLYDVGASRPRADGLKRPPSRGPPASEASYVFFVCSLCCFCLNMCICVYIYICIYIYRERERERHLFSSRPPAAARRPEAGPSLWLSRRRCSHLAYPTWAVLRCVLLSFGELSSVPALCLRLSVSVSLCLDVSVTLCYGQAGERPVNSYTRSKATDSRLQTKELLLLLLLLLLLVLTCMSANFAHERPDPSHGHEGRRKAQQTKPRNSAYDYCYYYYYDHCHCYY